MLGAQYWFSRTASVLAVIGLQPPCTGHRHGEQHELISRGSIAMCIKARPQPEGQ